MARLVVVVVIAVCACKSKPQGDPMSARVPKVESAAVTIAPGTATVPLLVFVEADGKVRYAVGPETWGELASFQPSAKEIPGNLRDAFLIIRESIVLGQPPAWIAGRLDDVDHDDLVGIDVELDRTLPGSSDDPPPPEEEEVDDEAGGTGTAMALEEGKMGKKDSDRAEGAYKMQKAQEDPELARRQKIEREREREMPGSRGRTSGFTRKDTADRLGTVSGAIEDPKFGMPPQGVAIAAHPGAKSTDLVDVITHSEGALLVVHGGDVRPLRLLFGPRGRGGTSRESFDWLEVRVTAKDLALEAVPAKPVTVARVADLGAAFDRLRAKHPRITHTEVLVAGDVDAQRLVDVLAALDTAGARAIALGKVPAASEPQARLRGKRIVALAIGRARIEGALGANVVRRVIEEARPKLSACYERELAANPDLAGTVIAQFPIDATGKVKTASAAGLDPAIASCMAGVLESLTFPAATNPAVTQVADLPLTIR